MPSKLTKERFIQRSKELYGENAFDYSMIEKVDYDKELPLVCRKHGLFYIAPCSHLDIKFGCPECSKEKRKKRKKMTNEEYKQMVINLHGNVYDLSKTEFISMHNHVTAVCPIHGEFSINAYHFSHKGGCPKCGIEKRFDEESNKKRPANRNRERLTTDRLISKSNIVHNFYYIYNKTDLGNKNEKGEVLIECPEHGEFWQNPYSHMNGHGCSKCGHRKGGKTQTMTTEQFITKANEANDNKYIYDNTVYKGCYEEVEIECPKHGKFVQKAYVHLLGHGCPMCAVEKNKKALLSTTEDFIESARKIHGYKNDYGEVDYKGAKIPVKIICEKGHVFWQTPNKHLQGHGCPVCNESKMEIEIRQFLEENGIQFEKEKTFEWLKYKSSLKLDFYLPLYNAAIECQGIQHFEDIDYFNKSYALEYRMKTDDIKRNLCAEQWIKVFYYANYQIDFPDIVFVPNY